MAKKKDTPMNLNPAWEVTYFYKHGRDEIEPGDFVKIKFQRGQFKFLRHVYHTEKGVAWLDCFGPEGYRSFYIEELKGKVKPKKFRRKKNVV